jgi:hypothetical protein
MFLISIQLPVLLQIAVPVPKPPFDRSTTSRFVALADHHQAAFLEDKWHAGPLKHTVSAVPELLQQAQSRETTALQAHVWPNSPHAQLPPTAQPLPREASSSAPQEHSE